MTMTYIANLTPPQLFIGKEYDDEAMEWIQENIEIMTEKLKEGVESLGLTFVNVKFGEYDAEGGIIDIKEIICIYNPTTCKELLYDLINDEVYITTGIVCYDFCRHMKEPQTGFYFVKLQN